MGGKYGTEITINYSGSNSLDTTQIKESDPKHLGYTSNYLGVGKEVYFRDLYVEVTKKINKSWKGTLVYSHPQQ